MDDDLSTLEHELGDHLRTTLHTVAANRPVPVTSIQERRRWGRRAGAVALTATLAVGAAAWAAQNDDAIVRLPVEEAMMTGDGPSGRWYLFPTEAVVRTCLPDPGAVLVAAQNNRPGEELDAGGVRYGEVVDATDGCGPMDESTWLGDPTRASFGHSRLGFERDSTPWGVFGTVHPTVVAVRVRADDQPPRTIATVPREDRPDGPRYVAFDVPAATAEARVELLDATGRTVHELTRLFSS